MDVTRNWSPVSRTALGVARIRAAESGRDPVLFNDPYAEMFLRAAPPLPPIPASVQAQTVYRRLAFQVAIRTRFYDDYLLAATAAGCTQVVLLAAGLDARAYRLTWPVGVHLFELDLPPLLTFKERVLQHKATSIGCSRIPVPIDLRDDWGAALIAVGFDPGRPTAWLAEGLLIYLSAEEVAALLIEVGTLSAPGSGFATEGSEIVLPPAPVSTPVPGLSPAAEPDSAPAPGPGPAIADAPVSIAAPMHEMGRATALWKGGLGRSPALWLEEHGWRCRSESLASVAARLGRSISSSSGSGFVTAVLSEPR